MKVLKIINNLLKDYFLLWININKELDDAMDYYEKSHRLYKKH